MKRLKNKQKSDHGFVSVTIIMPNFGQASVILGGDIWIVA
jgi:hypothetical protein